MRTQEELNKRMAGYGDVHVVYHDYGFIVWRKGTGDNIEILFIEVAEQRKGYGKRLIREMVSQIQPYHSVYIIRLAQNTVAGKFYRALGFHETLVECLYATDDAVIGTIPFEELKNI